MKRVCGPTCWHADSSPADCQCSCGGANHGIGGRPGQAVVFPDPGTKAYWRQRVAAAAKDPVEADHLARLLLEGHQQGGGP